MPTRKEIIHEHEEEIENLMQMYNYSKFMITELILNFPNDYKGVLRAFDTPKLHTIRVNTLKIKPEVLKKRLEEKGFRVSKVNWIDYAFHIDSSDTDIQLGATHEYLFGYYYLQDLASIIAVHLLSPQKNELVVDMCAAPGGKTTHIGQLMENTGKIVAVDAKESRMQSLESNVRRMGLTNTIIFPFDSTKLNQLFKSKFNPDKILLDAPCTGSGIIRKDESRKRSRDIKDVIKMASIQKHLLKTGLDILKPGGHLLYSTCSFHYQENEQVIIETVNSRHDVEIIEPYDPEVGLPGLVNVGEIDFGYELLKARRMYPNIHDTDAFFYCLLRKNN